MALVEGIAQGGSPRGTSNETVQWRDLGCIYPPFLPGFQAISPAFCELSEAFQSIPFLLT